MKIINCSLETLMQYPVQLTPINKDLSLYLPVPEKIRLAYEETLITKPDNPFPYWARVWPSSRVLMEYLEKKKELVTGRTVLEIGAGTGLPSFSIARIASSVTISDHSAEAVALMEKNIAYLGLTNMKAMCLDWNHFPETIHAELVLFSDVNYAPEQFAPLLELIQRFLKEESMVIITTPQRLMGASFLLQLGPYIRLNETMQSEGVDINLLILSK